MAIKDAIGQGVLTSGTRDEALAFVAEHRLTAAPVYDVADALDDPHFHARETIVELPDADGDLPCVHMHDVVPQFSATPAGFRYAAPRSPCSRGTPASPQVPAGRVATGSVTTERPPIGER